MNIYLDIETGPLPPEKREYTRPGPDDVKYGNAKKEEKRAEIYAKAVAEWERGEKAALDALTGEVLAVGYAVDDEPVQIIANEGGDEGELALLGRVVDVFKSVVAVEDGRIIGHNLIGFDIPFLIRRMLIWDCPPPRAVLKDLRQYRPAHFVDTMREWGLGDRHCYTKLTTLCGAFGIPAKTGDVQGKDFWLHWRDNREAAIAYLTEDVEAVRRLAEGLQL